MSILGAMGIPDWLLITVVAAIALYLFSTSSYGYFKKKKLPFLKPIPMLGNVKEMVFRNKSFSDMVLTNYKRMAGNRAMGFFEFRTPILMLRDPEIIKLICVKQFDHFVNHRKTLSEKADPLFNNSLFALRDKRWRNMRATLSPAFTSSKMKSMFLLISECGQQVVDYLKQQCEQQPGGSESVLTIEMKEFFTRFANDVIATSAFGVKCDSLKQPKNDFYMMGKDLTNFTGLKSLQFFIYAFLPKLGELTGISFFSKEASKFFSALIHDTVTTRQREGIIRPDMIHLMMEAGKAAEQDPTKLKLTEDDITAQATLFFFAGFETVTLLICFSTYLLAVHPEIQSRVQHEIDTLLDEGTRELTYDLLQKMKYLDMVVNETLRLYPPAPAVDRECVEPMTIPGTDSQPPITFEKGEFLWIPIYGLHRDPQYFPEPEKFDPERFSDERKDSIFPFSYLPFGLGPRMCIAQRFALMEAKAALVYLLLHFTLHVVDKTPIPMKLSTKSFNTSAAAGFWCGIKARNPKAKLNVAE